MNRTSSIFTASGILLAGTLLIGLLPQSVKAQVTITHDRTYQNPSSPGNPDTNDLAYIAFDPTFTNFNGQSPLAVAATQERAYTGSQTVTLTNGGSSLGPLTAYCVDISGTVGTTPYAGVIQSTSALNTGNPTTTPSLSMRGGAVAWLFNNSVVTSDLDSSALQLAIWESLYDWNGNTFTNSASMLGAGISFTDGNFRYYGTTGSDATTVDNTLSLQVFNQANSYLLAWGGKTASSAILLDTSEISDPGDGKPVLRQDLITNISPNAPEPGTLPLVGAAFPMIGLIGAGVRRRRRSA